MIRGFDLLQFTVMLSSFSSRSYGNISSKETFAIVLDKDVFREKRHSETELQEDRFQAREESVRNSPVSFERLSTKSSSTVALCGQGIVQLNKNLAYVRNSVKRIELCCNK
jgi:hypothetical protein